MVVVKKFAGTDVALFEEWLKNSRVRRVQRNLYLLNTLPIQPHLIILMSTTGKAEGLALYERRPHTMNK